MVLSNKCSEKIKSLFLGGMGIFRLNQPFEEACQPNMYKVIVNSFPKSGTHLLGKLVEMAGFIELPVMLLDNNYLDFKDKGDWHLWEPVVKAGIDIQNPSRKYENSSKSLTRILNGQFATSHLRYSAEIVNALNRHNISQIFIYRDLRDVICSVVNYRMSLKAHGYIPPWYYYLNALPSDEERLLTVIEGKDRFLESYVQHLEYGWGWLDDSSVLKVRFEDLVGCSGGGDDKVQLETIRGVLTFLGVSCAQEKLQEVASNLWGGNTRTMSQGLKGAWQKRFTERVNDAFEQKYGHYMLSMGYEL